MNMSRESSLNIHRDLERFLTGSDTEANGSLEDDSEFPKGREN